MSDQPKPSPPSSELLKEIKLPSAVLDADFGSGSLFAACLDGGVYRVDLDDGQVEKIGSHSSYASGVRGRGEMLISSGYDGALIWHDLKKGKALRTVQAHRFWSWQLALSPDGRSVASVTGQYLAGGIKYEPAAEQEPCVKVFDAETGLETHAFSHHPPVLSVAFSPDSRHLAAANMMGEIRVWNLAERREMARWTTPDFTSWGIIKSHHYVGGIFGLAFSPDGEALLACGMGPMRDPMAGNGKQTWQRFAWKEQPARKALEIVDGERGNGLMESLRFHPSGKWFSMTGRLAQGKWNVGLFESSSGALVHGLDAKMRVTRGLFTPEGDRMILCGAVGQEKLKNGEPQPFGRVKLFRVNLA